MIWDRIFLNELFFRFFFLFIYLPGGPFPLKKMPPPLLFRGAFSCLKKNKKKNKVDKIFFFLFLTFFNDRHEDHFLFSFLKVIAD